MQQLTGLDASFLALETAAPPATSAGWPCWTLAARLSR